MLISNGSDVCVDFEGKFCICSTQIFVEVLEVAQRPSPPRDVRVEGFYCFVFVSPELSPGIRAKLRIQAGNSEFQDKVTPAD